MIEEKELENIFFPKKIRYMELFEEKKYDEAWEECLSVEKIFPEPMYQCPLAYLWIEDIVRYSIETEKYDIGSKYAPLLMITGLKRCDDGTREYWIGKLEYELEHYITAKQFLLIAYMKNNEIDLFKTRKDKKYLELIKDLIKEIKNNNGNELEQIALAGNVDLQYKLGMMYEEENDVKKAIDFLTMAAKNGHNDAMNELGVMYCSGEVVEKNYQEGIRWLEEAAEHDNSDACGNLGMMYLKGISFKTDPQKALGYFIKSANLGNEHAMQQVADMYSEGIGTEKNEAVAQEWMEKIKEQEIYQKIEELCQSGETAFDDDELESALEYYLEAWELIPQPRGGYEGTGWVAAAIGEVLFEQEKYKESFDYYEEAYYAIGGKLNPYINFMMGKCLYLLNKKKEAASYLHMAYELDGETIFEDEDPVFIQLAKQ